MGWGWVLIWVWLRGGGGGCLFEAGRLYEVGANSRLGTYSNKYSISLSFLFFLWSLNIAENYCLCCSVLWYKRQSRCWVFLTQWLWSSSAGWPWINIRPPPESSQPCVLLGKYMWYSEKLPVKTTKVKVINIPCNFKSNSCNSILYTLFALSCGIVHV